MWYDLDQPSEHFVVGLKQTSGVVPEDVVVVAVEDEE